MEKESTTFMKDERKKDKTSPSKTQFYRRSLRDLISRYFGLSAKDPSDTGRMSKIKLNCPAKKDQQK